MNFAAKIDCLAGSMIIILPENKKEPSKEKDYPPPPMDHEYPMHMPMPMTMYPPPPPPPPPPPAQASGIHPAYMSGSSENSVMMQEMKNMIMAMMMEKKMQRMMSKLERMVGYTGDD